MKKTFRRKDGGIVKNHSSPYSKLRSVNLSSAKWTRGFWATRFVQCRDVTVPHLWKRLSDPETGHALTNLRIAAGLEEGEFQGTFWQDEWVYKWLEAVAYVYSYTGDAKLDKWMDEVIDIIAKAQEEDGYIATQILKVKERFSDPRYHELYVMGHLITAACIHYRITEKTNFLDAAKKTADYLYKTFMPRDPKLAHVQNDPSQIMALVELYRTTKDERYLKLANVFIGMFGATPGGTDQRQDRVPLREEEHVVGHAVFFTYLFAGAADAYMETGDETLLKALERLWKDLTGKKMYVTGGVCAVHRGLSIRGDPVHEAAGYDYDLPNSTAYNETCAQIGNFMWNWRMLLISGDAKYADVMELNLYNSIISGMGLDGASWFYTNPLRRYEEHNGPLLGYRYLEKQRFQPGEPPRRAAICCPSNLVRTIAGLYGYAYSVSEEGVWVNLYGGNTFNGKLRDESELKLTQETDYPWEGKVRIKLESVPKKPFSIMLRIPGWTEGASIKVNGKPLNVDIKSRAYATINRSWKTGDVIGLSMPMKTRLLEAHLRLEQCRNHVAIMRGPIVYCLESPDLPENIKISQVRIPRNIQLKARHDPNLLGGVTVLEGEALAAKEKDWKEMLYQEIPREPLEKINIKLIPYYAWANRGITEMTVWLPLA